MTSEYDLESVALPKLTGLPLLLFARALEGSASRALLMGKIERDSGIERLRTLTVEDPPTFSPVHGDVSAAGSGQMPAIEQIQAHAAASQFSRIRDYAAVYRDRRLTPVDVAERLIEAVGADRKMDRPLGALLAMHLPDLRSQAEASAARWASGTAIGPLDGVPIGVKDELDLDGYGTTVGTAFMGKTPCLRDATVVARLRAAGALLFGKLNMNELGINPDGGNMNYGLVRNPFDVAHDTGGSSSGSAAAVAAGLCPAAIGADGGGSIRIPAALCGVSGLKATFGRISEDGAAPLCWSVAHVGPIGATVDDVALLYAVLAGRDPRDSGTQHQPPLSLDGWDQDDLQGLRVGVYRPWFEHATSSVVAAGRRALGELEALGAKVEEIEIPGLNDLRVAHAITILSEMATSMENHRGEHSRFTLPTRVNLALGRTFTSRDYVLAQRIRTRGIEAFRKVFERVDVIVTPATAITAPKIPVEGPIDGWSDLESVTEVMRYAFPSNATGHPAMVVPIGADESHLPIGLQLIGKPWSEHLLLHAARVLEPRFPRPRPPRFYDLLA